MSTERARSVRYAFSLAALTGLFGARVLAQALQRWAPTASLPPFDEFQGSSLPYGFLLSTQILLLGWMIVATRDVAAGALPVIDGRKVRAARSRRMGRILAWVGGIYMAGSLARLAVGLAVADAPPWFTAWISAAFHIVLAAFVLTLAAYHGLAREAPR